MQTGLIQADDIKKFYSVKGNPEVMAGKIKEDEAFAKFLDTFDSIQKDGTVTFEVDARFYTFNRKRSLKNITIPLVFLLTTMSILH